MHDSLLLVLCVYLIQTTVDLYSFYLRIEHAERPSRQRHEIDSGSSLVDSISKKMKGGKINYCGPLIVNLDLKLESLEGQYNMEVVNKTD